MEPARKFKIIVNSKECGTCSGPTPSAVAKKVVKKLCGSSSKAVRFSLKECKRGCEKVCGPYQGRMEKLDRPYTRDGKTITHRVVCGKVRKIGGGDKNENIGIELNEIKERKLNIDYFKLPYKIRNYFQIKHIGLIPYLFLYSNEGPNMLKNKNYRNEYFTHYKFSIGDNSKIFQYKNGKIIEITDFDIDSLYETGLFELLLQETAFHNQNEKYITSKTIINIIKNYYKEYGGIIKCLEKLYSMYKRHKRNENHAQYMRKRNPNEL